MTAILTGMRWNLNVVLICISLMGKYSEHFLMNLLAICTFSFEKCLIHLLLGLFVLLVVNFSRSLYILDINPLPGK
jgi:hypothetical protein